MVTQVFNPNTGKYKHANHEFNELEYKVAEEMGLVKNKNSKTDAINDKVIKNFMLNVRYVIPRVKGVNC